MDSKPLERQTRDAAPPNGPESGEAGPYLCGDIDIRIGRDGTWFYHGSPIGRKPLVKLFASVLKRDEAGDYWLQTPVEKARIQVEDAPFVAVEMTVKGTGCDQSLSFRSNLDEDIDAGPEHPLRFAFDPATEEPSPYVLVRPGLEALIVRAVFYDLVDLAVEDTETHMFGVWSGGAFFPLGPVEDDS